MLLEGVFTAVTTPFNADGSLYLRKLEHNVSRYCQAPLSGLVILGSTGEAVLLNDEESRSVFKTARESSTDDKVLLAGIGRESVQETLKLAEYAATLEYDAVLVRTPHFYGPQLNRPAVLNYFRMVADQSPLPVVIYTIPRFTHYELPVDMVAELAMHPNIIGLKDSTGKVERVSAIMAATDQVPKRTVTVTQFFEPLPVRALKTTKMDSEQTFVPLESLGTGETATAVAMPKEQRKTRVREVGFQILAGSAQTMKASLDAGASGAVLAFAACAPQACLEIYQAWREHDMTLSEEKQQRILSPAQKIATHLGVAGVKYACELNGYYGGRPRLPLLPLTEEEKIEVDALMVGMK
jgi:dihydrodipicolinate synthase/N-acetylneuraminate lyase